MTSWRTTAEGAWTCGGGKWCSKGGRDGDRHARWEGACMAHCMAVTTACALLCAHTRGVCLR